MPKKRQTPEVGPTFFSRRNALIAGGVTAGLFVARRLGLFELFGGEENQESTYKETPKEQTPAPEVPNEPRLPEYEEWASKIKLPTFELSPEPLTWDFGEKLDYYLPKNNGKEQVLALHGELSKFRKKCLKDLKVTTNPYERYAIIKQFAQELGKLYYTAIGEPDREFSEVGDDVNRFLLTNDLYIYGSKNVALYDVIRAYGLTVRAGASKRQLPINFIQKKDDLLIIPGYQPVQYFAKHVEKGDYTLIEKISLQRALKQNLEALESGHQGLGIKRDKVEFEKAFKDHMNEVIAHESMHTALHMMGVDSRGDGAIKPKGTIKMGRYLLRQDEYLKFNNHQLHELAGLGYGLMHSGSVAPVSIWTAVVPDKSDYFFANFIATGGLVHSPKISPDLRRKLQSQGISTDDLHLAVSKLSHKELHHIGEQMVKLAIYLTQN